MNRINVKVLNELRNRNPLLAKDPLDMLYYSNLQNRAELQQGFPHPGFHKYLNIPEEMRSKKDYPKDFVYHINDMGFRGDILPVDSDNVIGCFGCSCTFGEGLPEEDIWPTKVANMLKRPHLNLGMPGVGSTRIALIFAAALRIWDIKTAVFCLPNYSRFHYVGTNNFMYSIIPAHPCQPAEVDTVRKDLVNHFSDQYLMSATRDAIIWILATAKAHGVNVILSSWDPETTELIREVMNYNSVHFELSMDVETARDMVHPGPTAHAKFASQIASCVNRRLYAST